MDQVYTTKQAAEHLGLAERTIRYYVAKGRLTPLQRIGWNFVFSREELDRFKALPRKGGRPRTKPKADDDGEHLN